MNTNIDFNETIQTFALGSIYESEIQVSNMAQKLFSIHVGLKVDSDNYVALISFLFCDCYTLLLLVFLLYDYCKAHTFYFCLCLQSDDLIFLMHTRFGLYWLILWVISIIRLLKTIVGLSLSSNWTLNSSILSLLLYIGSSIQL